MILPVLGTPTILVGFETPRPVVFETVYRFQGFLTDAILAEDARLGAGELGADIFFCRHLSYWATFHCTLDR